MKTSALKNLAIAVTIGASLGSASAADIYWSPGGSNPVTGGSGTWDLATSNFNTTNYGGDGSASAINYTAATLTGTTTSGSNTTTMTDTTGVATYQMVYGTGIVAGSTVSAVSANTSITLSANANASGTNSLTFSRTGDFVHFGGTAGTVTLSTPVSIGAGSLRFDVTGYTISGDATNHIAYYNPSNATWGNAYVGAGISANVSGLKNIAGLRFEVCGNGTLTVTNSLFGTGANTGGFKVGGTSQNYATTVIFGTGADLSNSYLRVNNTSTAKLNGVNLSVANFNSDTATFYNSIIENGGSANATLSAVNYVGGGTYYGILRDGSGGGNLGLTINKENSSQGITLAGTQANTYTGLTTIANGNLTLSKTAGVDAIAGNIQIGDAAGANVADQLILAANNQIKDTSVITINNGQASSRVAAFVLNGNNETVGGISSISTGSNSFIRNGAATASTLTVNDASNRTFSGVIENGSSGALNIVKSGIGSWTLNATNTYTGTTTISAGTLVLGTAGSIANSSIINLGTAISSGTLDVTSQSSFTVSSGQTLAGHGTINIGSGKTVTINGGLAPGNSPGVVSVNGNLTLNGTTTMEINGLTTPGLDYDQVLVSGDLGYGGTLALTIGNTLSTGTINLFTKVGYSGDFSAVTATGSYGSLTFTQSGGDLWTATSGATTLRFDQFSGDFNVIPEPSTWALLAASLTAFVVFRRRRQG